MTHFYQKSISHSIEQLKALMVTNHTDAFQLSTGRLKSHQEVIVLPEITLVKRTASQQILMKGVLKEDSLYFGFEKANLEMLVNGHPTNLSNFFISSPKEEMFVNQPSNSETLMVTIKISALKNVLDHKTYNFLINNSEKIRTNKIKLSAIEAFNIEMYSLCNAILEGQSKLPYVALLDFQNLMITKFATFIESMNITRQTPYINKRRLIIQRAFNYIEQSDDIFLNISDICEGTFCSIRTLEYAFKQILGVSPKHYLTIRRLHQIHADLMINKEQNIKGTLHKFGIINSGRFSKDYFQLFGEYPRETFKK